MRSLLYFYLLLLCPLLAAAATPWQSVRQPVTGIPQSIGGYSNGCIIGAQSLPLEAPGYQVMRQDQRRYFGHPSLIAFIQHLSQQSQSQKLGEVLVGDLGMPAGGRFSSGHASHQSGLDVDIWLQLPNKRWGAEQLLKPQPVDLVTSDGKGVVARHWQPQLAQLIKLAAQSPEVTRIFVNPAIKKKLCEVAGDDRDWLRKVRPWFGHRAHMHIRLRCPADSVQCEAQDTPPAGDGCGSELTSWFLPAAPGGKTTPSEPPPLPAACQALLDKHIL